MTALAISPTFPAKKELSLNILQDYISFLDRTERTTKAYLTNLRQFFAWIRFKRIPAPARPDVLAYRQWLQEFHPAIKLDLTVPEGFAFRTDHAGKPLQLEPCRSSTVKAYLQAVKAFFKWTAAEGLYPNIAENIHAPKVATTHNKDSLTAAEVVDVEQHIQAESKSKIEKLENDANKKDLPGRLSRAQIQAKRLTALYLLAVNAGLRTVELSRANIRDFESKGSRAWLWVWGKGHTSPDTRKALAPEVAQALREYLAVRNDNPTAGSPLFAATGNRSNGKRIAPTTISTMLKQALQAAGYDSPRLTAHSLRHTTAAAVMELSHDNIYQTQQYLRHASPATTEIYLDRGNLEADNQTAVSLYAFYHASAPHDSNQGSI